MRKVLWPVLVLVAAVAGVIFMVQARPEAQVMEPETQPPLVRAVRARLESLRLDVHSQGTVRPRTEAQLAAEVAGRIVDVAASFESGGFFSRGDVLVRLDDRDYELDRLAAEAEVAQARARLVRTEASAHVTLEEWRQLRRGEPTHPLIRHEPQLEEARALLDAAKAALEKTQLHLERTRIRAPFDGRVRSKLVDVGEFVSRGTPLAVVYAADHAEVRLPVASEDLRFLTLPGSGEPGPEVVLEGEFAGERHRWRGRIVRTEGELDLESRMMHLVARVKDPFGRRRGGEERAPLPIGLFVGARIEGKTLARLVRLPRAVMRVEDRVFVVDPEDRLRYRTVDVLRSTPDAVILRGGVEAGERVCTSPLDAAVDGMRVRVIEEPAAGAAGGDGVPSAR